MHTSIYTSIRRMCPDLVVNNLFIAVGLELRPISLLALPLLTLLDSNFLGNPLWT